MLGHQADLESAARTSELRGLRFRVTREWYHKIQIRSRYIVERLWQMKEKRVSCFSCFSLFRLPRTTITESSVHTGACGLHDAREHSLHNS